MTASTVSLLSRVRAVSSATRAGLALTAVLLGVTLLSPAGLETRHVLAAGAESDPDAVADTPAAEVTLAFSGDILPHSPVLDQAATGSGYSFEAMFADVTPLLERVDLAVCHLEAPLSPDGSDISTYPDFNAPPELADAIAATGYDACSTASNHSLDRGGTGVGATLDVLDRAGLGHAGTARTPSEADEPVLYETAGGIQVGHVSGAFGFNGFVPDTPWRVNDLDPDRLLAQARRTRQAGADIVVASLHWGAQYQSEPTAQQRALAARLAAGDDIDLIVGHHAHVVQPIERIGDTTVVYGLGNFLTNQSAACCTAATQDGMIAMVRMEREAGADRFTTDLVEFAPTYVRRPDYRILPVARAASDPDAGVPVAELRASWDRTVSVAGAGGVAVPRGAPPGTPTPPAAG